MHAKLSQLYIVFSIFMLTACGEAPAYTVSAANTYFELKKDYAPLPLKDENKGEDDSKDPQLKKGRYHSYYSDKNGIYFEIPKTMNANYLSDGGIYITHTSPRQAFLYSHDATPNVFYAPHIGVLQRGGSGNFKTDHMLPETFLNHITLNIHE